MNKSSSWLLLIASLPTSSATPRMRLWRALKSLGCAPLRDGAYLLPNTPIHTTAFVELAEQTNADGGQAWVVDMSARSGSDDANFQALFDRSNDYVELITALNQARKQLSTQTQAEVTKTFKKLRKEREALKRVDFFPNDASMAAVAAWSDFEDATNTVLAPGEPSMESRHIPLLNIGDYQGRVWATRRNPWVDRLASAWLIRRFIDSSAKLLWLDKPENCPKDALGFDFDNAAFTHIDNKVTFEVLLASFGLEQPALVRMGALVHYLDEGGAQPPEASGVESVLAGLRETVQNDDQLLAMASSLFDGLLSTFEKNPQ
ncbi:chromate resistance protein ChrB domain-containing protein [Herminiimonas fonticola]|uniref:Chromate resistance exported protein n=1 Tax=Herminiimonas fonticola TaxID=303380 RepID=A0A4R6GJ06_9BURK|nr:chromate resistance protein ChrB domain-containing protein [Herminiimonas fonticola]TDN94933.1 hypothetical protein EV677_1496 [Herminiimonas fonticola]